MVSSHGLALQQCADMHKGLTSSALVSGFAKIRAVAVLCTCGMHAHIADAKFDLL